MGGKKIFITGMAGYFAGRLCRELDRIDWCEKFYGVDVRKPLYKYDRAEFRIMDINSPELGKWVSEIKPDIFIHLAFLVEEIHNKELMRRVNVAGTGNALKACEMADVPQILVASSGTAYGAWKDNPIPLKEEHSLKPNPGFYYAVHKAELEDLCNQYIKRHPKTIFSIIRPCVVYGPNVSNYLSDLVDMPILTGIRGYAPPLQFIHEDDLCSAILLILEKQGRGAFNLAPEDTITFPEIFEMSKKMSVNLPYWLMVLITALFWKLHIFKFSTGFLDYIRYPWVIDSSRLRNELGFKFRYSSRETMEILLRSKKILP